MSQKLISRRNMLKFASVGVGALAVACQPKVVVQTVEVEKVVEVEKQVVQTVEVEKVVEKEVVQTVEVEKVVEKEVTRVVEVPKEAEVKGTFWVLQKKDFFPAFNDWFRAEMTAFCKERGWPLDISYMAGFTGGTPEIEKINATVAAGTPADLIMHSLGITQLKQAYSLDPVTDVVETVVEAWGEPFTRQKNDLYMDDNWWAVPYFTRSDGGWFQRPAFENAGIDIHKIRQYTDLWDACLEVSDPANELYGWGTTINRSGDGDWFRNRVQHGWGAYIQDESGEFVTVDSEEMVEAITAMTNIYTDDKYADMMPPGVLAWTDGSNNEAYLAGKLAYTQNGGTVYGKAVKDNNPIKDITGFHAPAGGPVNEEFNSLSANNFMLLRGARNPEAAKETMLHFLLPLENQDKVFSNAPAFCLPAYTDLWAASEYMKENPTAAELESVATNTAGVVPGTYPGPTNNPAMAAAGAAGIMNDMVADVLRGTAVADAVKTAHDRHVAIFKEFGLPGEK